jgi:quercetin dioxygenase-like cupin family protein
VSEEDFITWRDAALSEGFDEVLVREWPTGTVLDEHAHPFELKALVASGEMFLTVAGKTRRLVCGDTFALEANVPHAEHYGEDGACYWVARRHTAA